MATVFDKFGVRRLVPNGRPVNRLNDGKSFEFLRQDGSWGPPRHYGRYRIALFDHRPYGLAEKWGARVFRTVA